MESLVAGVKSTQKKWLRVVDVDPDRSPALVRELDVTTIPSLVLVKDRHIVGRLEGRATAPADPGSHPPARRERGPRVALLTAVVHRSRTGREA